MAEVDISAVFALLGNMSQGINRLETQGRDHAQKLTELRQTITEYHAAVLGHGILISELDERIRRLERLAGILPAQQ
jgi:hypothetical protein